MFNVVMSLRTKNEYLAFFLEGVTYLSHSIDTQTRVPVHNILTKLLVFSPLSSVCCVHSFSFSLILFLNRWKALMQGKNSVFGLAIRIFGFVVKKKYTFYRLSSMSYRFRVSRFNRSLASFLVKITQFPQWEIAKFEQYFWKGHIPLDISKNLDFRSVKKSSKEN